MQGASSNIISSTAYVQLMIANDSTSPLRCVDSSVCLSPYYSCSLPAPRHGHSALVFSLGGADYLFAFAGEVSDLSAVPSALSADLHSASFQRGLVTWIRHRLGYKDANESTHECVYPLSAAAAGKCPVQRRDAAVVLMANTAGQNGRMLVFGGMTYCTSTENRTCSSASPLLSLLERSSSSPPTALNDLWFLDLTDIDSACLMYGACPSILLWTLVPVSGQQPGARWGAGIVLDTASNTLYITGGFTTETGDSGAISYITLNDMFLYQLLDPYVSSCSASGDGLTVSYAGVQTTFSISCKDVFGSAATGAIFSVQLSGPIVITPSVSSSNVLGTYQCIYEAVKAGSYTLEIRVGRGGSMYQDLISQPYSVVVHPSDTSPSDSTASGDFLSISTAGVVGTFVIVALDSLGNRRPGGDSISALMFLNGDYSALPETGSVTDKSDGSYDVTFVFTRAGAYQMQLTISDTLAASSPYALTVNPGPTSISQTYSYGYFAGAAAGEYSTIYVQTRDSYGNFAVVDVTLYPNGVEVISFTLCHTAANQTTGLACQGC